MALRRSSEKVDDLELSQWFADEVVVSKQPHARSSRLSIISSCSYHFDETPILSKLPDDVFGMILEHVSQDDLCNVARTSRRLHKLAMARLYRRIMVVVNASYPTKYDRARFVRNGFRFMDAALVTSWEQFDGLIRALDNPRVLDLVRLVVFERCFMYSDDEIFEYREALIQRIRHAKHLLYFHIPYLRHSDGLNCYQWLTGLPNIRRLISKIFVTDSMLEAPCVSQVNFLMDEHYPMDLTKPPYNQLLSLQSLHLDSEDDAGLDVLKHFHGPTKIHVRELMLTHYHTDFSLDFSLLEKVDLRLVRVLTLRVDCALRRDNCMCFHEFFKDLKVFFESHDHVLDTLDVELVPSDDWLRPHQLLEEVFAPVGEFIKSLRRLERLRVDLCTPSFKMFENFMSSTLLNKLNKRLMEAFFLCFFVTKENNTVDTLRTLQLPDLLTSFFYYKPDFYLNLLHTCTCDGCAKVLALLDEHFLPLQEPDEDFEGLDDESLYYVLFGHILAKLQADREVFVPVNGNRCDFAHYPMYKGDPNTLCTHYHDESCECPDIDALATVYVVHQLRPVVNFLALIFVNLDYLMVHGIYYQWCDEGKRMVTIFDEENYPEGFGSGQMSDLAFGSFDA